jgi:hypothetical protein
MGCEGGNGKREAPSSRSVTKIHIPTYLHKCIHTCNPPSHSFTVALDARFELLVNDERTRSFLTVGVGAGCDDRLRRLVASVDAVLARYRQPLYYADPKFHVSVASLKGDAAAAWEAAGAEGQKGEEDAAAVVVDMVECRVGHKLFEIPLREL